MAELRLLTTTCDQQFLEKIVQLYRETFAELPHNENWSREQVLDMFQVYRKESVLFAIIEDQIAGFCCGLFFQSWSTFEDKLYAFLARHSSEIPFQLDRCFYVAELVVGKSHRSHNIGSQMLFAMEEIARDSGFPVVILYCLRDNPRAERFYIERCGYSVLTAKARGELFAKARGELFAEARGELLEGNKIILWKRVL